MYFKITFLIKTNDCMQFLSLRTQGASAPILLASKSFNAPPHISCAYPFELRKMPHNE